MKKGFSIKFKISFSVLVISVFCSIFIGGFSYFNYRGSLINFTGLRAQNIVQAVGDTIDGDKIVSYDKTGKTDEDYQKLLDYLDRVKKDTNLTYLYVFVDAGDNYKYIAEAPSDEGAVQLGDTDGKDQYGPVPAEVLSSGKAAYTGVSNSSQWGDLLSGFAPVTDSSGKAVAVVGMDISTQIINESMNQYLPVVLAIMLFSCVFSYVLIFFVVNRVIVKPVKVLVAASEKMAEGKLDIAVPNRFLKKRDEIGKLYYAFSTVAEHMSLIIKEISFVLAEMSGKNLDVEIRENYMGDFQPIKDSIVTILDTYNTLLHDFEAVSKQVSLSSRKVSDISGYLASGSIRQSSAVEQLSSSMMNISEDANSNVHNVDKTREYISDMSKNVQLSNEQMGQMLTAMEEINASSSHISKIIKVIDDITFQTNLLALNAAVEAARAGAAGKGFAVVADEVRNLAIKTSQAASQTSELITDSINAVRKGTGLAEQTARALDEVSAKSKLVNEHIDEIAKISYGQASAISEIMSGINQISEVVQNNSAQSQESAASSEELTSQAEVLHCNLSEFRLKVRGGGSSNRCFQEHGNTFIEKLKNGHR